MAKQTKAHDRKSVLVLPGNTEKGDSSQMIEQKHMYTWKGI